MQKAWTDNAWEDYLYWQMQDKRTLKRINMILKDIDREPFVGLGKPEPLKGDKQGYWSRRIDEVNRIIYKVENDQFIMAKEQKTTGLSRDFIIHQGETLAEVLEDKKMFVKEPWV